MPRSTPLHFNVLLALTVLLLSGCSALSPYSSVTKLDLTLSASDQVNLDLNGRPSPLVIRLLELKHPVAFENVDFFSLYERPKPSLSPDLVTSEELTLRPGESVDLKLSVEPGSRYVGVLAAYRDLPQTQWRYVVVLASGELTNAHLVFDQAGIHNAERALAQADD